MLQRRLVLLLAIWVLLNVCASALCAPALPAAKVKNVILMIGDGMGVVQVQLARLSLPDKSQGLHMDSMPHSAFVRTSSANSIVTDSAAAATALATGFKTNNGMVGVLPNGKVVPNIREAAAGIGKATGLVTTTTITHATPAGFGAHVSKRGDEADVAVQYIQKKIDVLFGGGRQFFIPETAEGSKRKDGRDLIAEAKKIGYSVIGSREELLSVRPGKVIGLFQMGALTTDPPEPTLAELTRKALELLSADRDGFFLMVEGGQIDWACHANDVAKAVKQTLDFDAAVGEALQFASKRKDTLVIVTADHETGGLSIQGSEEGGMEFKAVFSTKGHTAVHVPLFAFGAGADAFHGLLDNTTIPKIIAGLLGIKGFAK